MNPANLAGARVLVTGAAGGAGAQIARAFHAAGSVVHVCDIDAQAVARWRQDQPDIAASVADVADRLAVDRLFDGLEAAGGLDVLVNNVGIAGPTAAAEHVALEDWDRTMAVNLGAHFLCCRRAIPTMKARGGGAIVNISSTSARTGLPLRLPYVVSKAAVLSLTTNLARELGPAGIRVNAILPGGIRGPRLEKVIANKAEALGVTPAAYERDLVGFISMRTLVEPADIAAMAVFLASPAARFVSGQLIGVCGNVEYEA
ncbi:MAG: SDR family oxidoreductase [Alphaproteobacteria bacterium]|nr:SDR family oxidoreductase [Alphaproteobacteria bacterium]